jgi:hypothetical protein
MNHDGSRANLVWLRARFEFGTTFSYRLPDASSQFAIGPPIPSPAAVKLALVAAAIHGSGDVGSGASILDLVRSCRVWFGLPPRVARFRACIKRLKPAKTSGFVEPPATRDYYLFDSTLDIFVQVAPSAVPRIRDLLRRIRRFGTSDSLCWCWDMDEVEPRVEQCAVPLEDRKDALLDGEERILISLLDLAPTVTFEQIDPYSYRSGRSAGDPFVRVAYAVPLKIEASGGNWAVLTRSEPVASTDAQLGE